MARRSNHYEAAFEAYVRSLRVPCVAVDESKRPLDRHAEAKPARPADPPGPRSNDPAGSFDTIETNEVDTTPLRLKNPDFLVYPRLGCNLVVEVKGKRGKDHTGRRRWENWVTTDDLDGLARWRDLFGPGYRAILAFVYAERPPATLVTAPAGSPWPDSSQVVRLVASRRRGRRNRRPTAKDDPLDAGFPFRGRRYWFWAVELDDYLDHLRSRGIAWKAVAMARAEFRRRVRPLLDWLPHAAMTTTSARSHPPSPATSSGAAFPCPAPVSEWTA